MKKISFLLISIALIVFVGCNNSEKDDENTGLKDTIEYPSYDEYQDGNVVENTNQDNFLDSNEVNIDGEQIMVEDEEGNIKPIKEEELKNIDNVNHNFNVIVGSFKIQNNAEKAINFFKTKGYKPVILPKTGSYYRVAIASFQDEKTSRQELKRLRKVFNFA